MPIVLPYIPRTITVHLGPPDQWAENVTVSFPEYVKNVTSSEIYPTWEPSAIRANVLAIISFALNRVYTDHYPSRGYDFQITSTTAYDQKFIRDRNIFENISEIVDDTFNSYIRRIGFVEPLAAKFCNGTTTTCRGLSQWGSQNLAQQGLNSIEILRHYYGNDIEIVVNAPVQELGESYPGTPQRLGMVGEPVFVIQVSLNRIAQNYPAIPKIWPVNGIYDEKTEQAVQEFQKIFNLAPDGVVGPATWYRLAYLYVGITRLSELISEGQRYRQIGFRYPGVLREGSSGTSVRTLQYMLGVLAEFNRALDTLPIDGEFGSKTLRAVRAYQSYAGLPPDGVVGEQTWNRLYRDYIGIGNYLQNDRVRFFGDPVAEAMGRADRERYGTSARLGQFPGFTMGLGSTDQKGEKLV
ncbi:MAG: spore cortex-lytic protein [Lawsonibacter sp.]|nr:spore cortex-lytic protein [Lawsonibacter sp.]